VDSVVAFSKSVLVLIDGRNVYTPLFAGVNWKLQNVMLEDVDGLRSFAARRHNLGNETL